MPRAHGQLDHGESEPRQGAGLSRLYLSPALGARVLRARCLPAAQMADLSNYRYILIYYIHQCIVYIYIL